MLSALLVPKETTESAHFVNETESSAWNDKHNFSCIVAPKVLSGGTSDRNSGMKDDSWKAEVVDHLSFESLPTRLEHACEAEIPADTSSNFSTTNSMPSTFLSIGQNGVSTIINEAARELAHKTTSSEASTFALEKHESGVFQAVKAFVYDGYDSSESILKEINDSLLSDDWKIQIKNLEKLQSIAYSHEYFFQFSELKNLIQNTVKCCLSLRSLVSKTALKTLTCLIYALSGSPQGAAALDYIIPSILPKCVGEKKFVSCAAQNCLETICRVPRPNLQVKALSCLSQFMKHRNAAMASKSSELIADIVDSMLPISSVLSDADPCDTLFLFQISNKSFTLQIFKPLLPLIAQMLEERQPLAKQSARRILNSSKTYFHSSKEARVMESKKALSSPEKSHGDSFHFDRFVRGCILEVSNLSLSEKNSFEKALVSLNLTNPSPLISPRTNRSMGNLNDIRKLQISVQARSGGARRGTCRPSTPKSSISMSTREGGREIRPNVVRTRSDLRRNQSPMSAPCGQFLLRSPCNKLGETHKQKAAVETTVGQKKPVSDFRLQEALHSHCDQKTTDSYDEHNRNRRRQVIQAAQSSSSAFTQLPPTSQSRQQDVLQQSPLHRGPSDITPSKNKSHASLFNTLRSTSRSGIDFRSDHFRSSSRNPTPVSRSQATHDSLSSFSSFNSAKQPPITKRTETEYDRPPLRAWALKANPNVAPSKETSVVSRPTKRRLASSSPLRTPNPCPSPSAFSSNKLSSKVLHVTPIRSKSDQSMHLSRSYRIPPSPLHNGSKFLARHNTGSQPAEANKASRRLPPLQHSIQTGAPLIKQTLQPRRGYLSSQEQSQDAKKVGASPNDSGRVIRDRSPQAKLQTSPYLSEATKSNNNSMFLSYRSNRSTQHVSEPSTESAPLYESTRDAISCDSNTEVNAKIPESLENSIINRKKSGSSANMISPQEQQLINIQPSWLAMRPTGFPFPKQALNGINQGSIIARYDRQLDSLP